MPPSTSNLNTNSSNDNRFDEAELERLRQDSALLRSTIESDGVKLKKRGKLWLACCPFHNERTPSFTVYPDHYHCYGCNANGTIIDYVMLRHNLDFRQAAEQLLGRSQRQQRNKTTNGQSSESWSPILPAPEPHNSKIVGDEVYEYVNQQEKILFYVKRFEAKNGQPKMFVPLTYGVLNGQKGWFEKAPLSPLPLYGLGRLELHKEKTVILCEGEKCADAVERIANEEGVNYIGVTWMGGSNRDKDCDFSPLHGRKVIIWPDADIPGVAAAKRIYARIKDHCEISWVDTKGLPNGFDVADLEEPLEDWLKIRLKRHEKPNPIPFGTMAELEGKKFMPLKWVVPGFLPEGCTILAGKPKVGKSFFVLAACYAVAIGGKMLGQTCEKKTIWYLALEDTERRMKDRFSKMCPPPWPDNIKVSYAMPGMDEDGVAKLEATLIANPEIKVVCIDTLVRIQGKALKNESPYQHDYRTVAALSDLARRNDVSIIVVHHVRKAESHEVFDTVLGSTGLTGAADTVAVMDRVEQGLRFYARGRDLDEVDKLLDWDSDTNNWDSSGDYEKDAETSNTRQRILILMSQSKYPLTPKDIAEKLGVASVTIRKQLTRLAKEGKIKKNAYGSYGWNDGT